MAQTVHGKIDGRDRRVTVVVARFNELVTDRLLHGALQALRRAGVAEDAIRVVHVPGAFELPQACRWASSSADAVVALGCVIRGATDHYEYVCAQAARGILDAGLESGVPMGFGLLTCETLEQALDRAGGKVGNKGADATLAALEMLGVSDALSD